MAIKLFEDDGMPIFNVDLDFGESCTKGSYFFPKYNEENGEYEDRRIHFEVLEKPYFVEKTGQYKARIKEIDGGREGFLWWDLKGGIDPKTLQDGAEGTDECDWLCPSEIKIGDSYDDDIIFYPFRTDAWEWSGYVGGLVNENAFVRTSEKDGRFFYEDETGWYEMSEEIDLMDVYYHYDEFYYKGRPLFDDYMIDELTKEEFKALFDEDDEEDA